MINYNLSNIYFILHFILCSVLHFIVCGIQGNPRLMIISMSRLVVESILLESFNDRKPGLSVCVIVGISISISN